MTETKSIPLSEILLRDEEYKRINKSIADFKKAGIDIFITEAHAKYLNVVIKQTKLLNGNILNNKQLHDRALDVFYDLDYEIHVKPAVFSLDVEHINVAWIEEQMQQFGINRKDLIKQLALDKSSLSLIFSGDRGLTKFTKAAFFYYFLTYELNRDLRNAL